jgi:hypothetical protein
MRSISLKFHLLKQNLQSLGEWGTAERKNYQQKQSNLINNTILKF